MGISTPDKTMPREGVAPTGWTARKRTTPHQRGAEPARPQRDADAPAADELTRPRGEGGSAAASCWSWRPCWPGTAALDWSTLLPIAPFPFVVWGVDELYRASLRWRA